MLQRLSYKKLLVVKCCWNWHLWSISSRFFARILSTKVRSKPNSKQRKDARTKNVGEIDTWCSCDPAWNRPEEWRKRPQRPYPRCTQKTLASLRSTPEPEQGRGNESSCSMTQRFLRRPPLTSREPMQPSWRSWGQFHQHACSQLFLVQIPNEQKYNQVVSVFFALWGSAREKAVFKMLMKLK